MLKIGCWLLGVAGILLGGYATYAFIRLIVAAPELHIFFKVIILLGVFGLALVLMSLAWERRKEKRDDPNDHGEG
jgi:hypothetical protein